MISGQTLRIGPEGKTGFHFSGAFPDCAPIQLASGRAAILEDIAAAAVALSHARLDHIGLSSMPKAQSCIGQRGSTIRLTREE